MSQLDPQSQSLPVDRKLVTLSLVILLVAVSSAAAEDVCVDQIDGEMLENEDDCGTFIMCLDEEALVLPCTPGKVFILEDLACVRGDVDSCIPYVIDDDEENDDEDSDE